MLCCVILGGLGSLRGTLLGVVLLDRLRQRRGADARRPDSERQHQSHRQSAADVQQLEADDLRPGADPDDALPARGIAALAASRSRADRHETADSRPREAADGPARAPQADGSLRRVDGRRRTSIARSTSDRFSRSSVPTAPARPRSSTPITGIYEPTSGSIEFHGRPLAAPVHLARGRRPVRADRPVHGPGGGAGEHRRQRLVAGHDQAKLRRARRARFRMRPPGTTPRIICTAGSRWSACAAIAGRCARPTAAARWATRQTREEAEQIARRISRQLIAAADRPTRSSERDGKWIVPGDDATARIWPHSTRESDARSGYGEVRGDRPRAGRGGAATRSLRWSAALPWAPPAPGPCGTAHGARPR